MIRRQDKFLNADEPAGASGQGGKGGASQGNTDFSAWDTTKKSVPGVLNAAREVRNWMNRVSLSRDDDEVRPHLSPVPHAPPPPPPPAG